MGLGIGGEHLAAFDARPDLFEVVALCDLEPDRLDRAAAGRPGTRTTTELDDVVRADDVEVVCICTPPFLHVEQTHAAMDAGKTVVLEKPVAGSLRAVDELVELEAGSDGRIMPVFQYRYGRGLQRLRALQAAGLAGRAFTTTIDVSWRRGRSYYSVPWRGRWATELGGLLTSHCVHALDMATYVLGEPARAQARVATLVNDIETEDCASVSLELADGSLLTLSATLGSMGERSWHRFCFEHLSAESNTAPYSNSSDPWTFVGRNERVQGDIDACLADHRPAAEGYQRQFELLHESIVTGGPLPVTLADARRSVQLLTALYASAHQHEDAVLPLAADHPFYDGWQP